MRLMLKGRKNVQILQAWYPKDTVDVATRSAKLVKNFPGCPVEATLSLLDGKWKGVILFHLMERTLRFNEIRRKLPAVTQRMLTKQLTRARTSPDWFHAPFSRSCRRARRLRADAAWRQPWADHQSNGASGVRKMSSAIPASRKFGPCRLHALRPLRSKPTDIPKTIRPKTESTAPT